MRKLIVKFAYLALSLATIPVALAEDGFFKEKCTLQGKSVHLNAARDYPGNDFYLKRSYQDKEFLTYLLSPGESNVPQDPVISLTGKSSNISAITEKKYQSGDGCWQVSEKTYSYTLTIHFSSKDAQANLGLGEGDRLNGSCTQTVSKPINGVNCG